MSRIRDLRIKSGYSQKELANVLFVNQTAVSQWERGATAPNSNALRKMCEIFATTSDYLLEISDDSNSQPERIGVMVPVCGSVAAGIPLAAFQEIIDYEEITKDMAQKGEYFALRVKGDSMEPRICNGDTVIALRQATVENGGIAIVLVNGDEATCKKVCFHPDGISLVSSNLKYMPMFYTAQQVDDLPITILGQVVELRGKV